MTFTDRTLLTKFIWRLLTIYLAPFLQDFEVNVLASMCDCVCMHLRKYLVISVKGILEFLNLLKCEGEWWSVGISC